VDQRAKADAFRRMHHEPPLLVLPNAWDVASAKRLAALPGCRALATTSAAVARSLGWEDGEQAPADEVLTAAARIARSVDVPLTVDFERGYALEPAAIVERLAATGAVGVNLEDSDPPTGAMIEPAEQATFLAAVRSSADALGGDLVINARTDSFLRHAGTREEQLAASLERGKRYLAAGADCIYPIGASDPGTVRALVEGMDAPVNIGFGRGQLSIAELADLGAARVSFGPTLQGHLYDKFASELLSAVAAGQNPFEV
jgi:2-methylisocitrate lyase-like PEP mutase family enzyme